MLYISLYQPAEQNSVAKETAILFLPSVSFLLVGDNEPRAKGYEGAERFDKHRVSQSSQADHGWGSDDETTVDQVKNKQKTEN